jgi:hypothetical protein
MQLETWAWSVIAETVEEYAPAITKYAGTHWGGSVLKPNAFQPTLSGVSSSTPTVSALAPAISKTSLIGRSGLITIVIAIHFGNFAR